jgi:hypothetical protein
MSKTFAILIGDVVSNVIVAESLEIAEAVMNAKCVEYTADNPAQIGWIYDEATENFAYVAPIEEAPAE